MALRATLIRWKPQLDAIDAVDEGARWLALVAQTAEVAIAWTQALEERADDRPTAELVVHAAALCDRAAELELQLAALNDEATRDARARLLGFLRDHMTRWEQRYAAVAAALIADAEATPGQ